MRGPAALALALASLAAVACNEPTGPSRQAAASDCTQTAAILAQLELGPQAKPDPRASAVAKHTAACEAARLTQSERECITRATNTWAAIDCAPRMFPRTKPATKASCMPVVARMRAAILSDLPSQAGSAGVTMVDRMMQVAETSCLEDAWPEPYLACVMASKVGDMASFKACHDLMPKAIQDKVETRMTGVQPPSADPPSGSGSSGSDAAAPTPTTGSAAKAVAPTPTAKPAVAAPAP